MKVGLGFVLSAMLMTLLSVSLLGTSSAIRLLISLFYTIDTFQLGVGHGLMVIPPLFGLAFIDI
ncbi:hypothetical protein ACS0TY_018020 [Phlomoides rotata]